MSRKAKLTEQLRRAIDRAPMSRYAICKAIGFSESSMSRFMAGKGGLSLDVLDRIADLLDLRIASGSGSKRKGK